MKIWSWPHVPSIYLFSRCPLEGEQKTQVSPCRSVSSGGHIGIGPGPRGHWTARQGGNSGPLASRHILLGIVSPVDALL